MSQQAADGQGVRRIDGRKPQYFSRGGGGESAMKAFNSLISGIEEQTFNTGHNKYVAHLMQSCKNMANFLQCTTINEGFLRVGTLRTRK